MRTQVRGGKTSPPVGVQTTLYNIEGKGDFSMKYSNSSLVSHIRLSPHHSGQRVYPIDRITPHCVVGHSTVEGLGELFANPACLASSNYGIDDQGRVGLYVEEKNRSRCSSSYENDQRAVTIECASDVAEPYAMSENVYNCLIDLCVDICQRYGKKRVVWISDKEKALSYQPDEDTMQLTVHRWFANKSCPGDWLFVRLGDVAEKVTARLATLSTPVVITPSLSSSTPVADTPDQNGETPSPWAAESVKWAVENSILLGDGKSYRLHDPVTREEMLTFLHRALSR